MDNRTIEEVRKNETKLIEEIKSLEKQLEYLRSGEYYNQLRFENEMLQQVVDTNGVPSEVYDYIDCTHRNTELLKENQELKKQLEEAQEKIILLKASKPMLEYKKALEENQQKEFMEYINEKIDICDGFIDTIRSDLENISYGGRIAGKTYIANEIMKNEVAKKTLEEILSKYKEIIGGKE